jgi:excisionase family DNA binding protein
MATVPRTEPKAAPRYGSAAQLAAYAGLSVKTIRRMVEAGELRGFKVGSRLLIAYADLDRHILRRALIMAVAKPQPRTAAAPPAPNVPPISPEELARRNDRAIALLERWKTEGDEAEQTETLEFLREALGRNRVAASRPLFP